MSDFSEKNFKSWIKTHWRGWLSSYEPRKGGTIGIADLQIVVENKIVPIELKIGRVIKSLVDGSELLDICDIRPVQIQWHKSLFEKGGVNSFFLVGVGSQNKLNRIFIFQGRFASKFLKPVKFEESYADEIEITNFSRNLEKFILGSVD